MIKIKYKIIKFSKLYLKDIWKIRNLKDSRKFSISKNGLKIGLIYNHLRSIALMHQ